MKSGKCVIYKRKTESTLCSRDFCVLSFTVVLSCQQMGEDAFGTNDNKQMDVRMCDVGISE